MRIASKFALLLIVILGIGTILPLFHSGFFTFHDNTQVERVYEMGVALSDKVFPVRWVTNLGYGYGYPIFNFYGPLPYYIGGVLTNSGFGALVATKIMFGIGILFSGVTMFYLSRKYFGVGAGIVSSVAYMYFPYHAVNIYVRGAVGEFFAYAALPLVFLGLFKLFDLKKSKLFSGKNYFAMLPVSLGVFLVATSHNLSIFMLLLLIIPFTAVSLILSENRRNFLLLLIVSIIVGMFLSSFYIIPAFLEMSYTNVSSQVGGGANFVDHYVCPSQLWSGVWSFGGSVEGCVDGLSFKLGKVHILLAVLGLIPLVISLYRKKFEKHDKLAIVCFVMIICSVLLLLSTSNFIWQSIPFMKYIQYPWRFLNFIGLFTSVIGGYFVFKINQNIGQKGIILVVSIVILLIITNYKLFSPQIYIGFPEEFYTSKNHINFETSRISDEYMPSGFQTPKSFQELPPSRVELLKTTGNIGILSEKTGYLKASYQALSDGVIHVNTAYFPGWSAYVNNTKLAIIPTSKGMNVSIPSGSGVFTMKLFQTPLEIVSNALSVLAFLGLLIGIIKISSRRK